ncbi:hypothetical protein [Methylorubrum extorquens]
MSGSKAAIPFEAASCSGAARASHRAEGRIDPAFGRSPNQVEKLRLSSDYFGDVLAADDGRCAVEQADAFVNEVKARFPGL